MEPPILIPTTHLRAADLERFRNAPFENMIKFTVDIRQRRLALGGEMHADSEMELVNTGSEQADIWGGNLWPWVQPARIEYISLINIRPGSGNRGMDIQLSDVRAAVDDVVKEWVDLR